MTPAEGPLFVVEHQIEISASSQAVWAVLSDFSSYPEWNPYVLEIDGMLTPGSPLRVTIAQENWPEPITVEPVVARCEPDRILHWHGDLGAPNLLDTDHVFAIHALDSGGVRFHQYEEFRGTIAETIDEEARGFTRDAFEAMNTALAERVAQGQ